MKQEQLKKLAEWSKYQEKVIGLPIQFNPLKDSNQLDMLKLKYIKEAKIGEAKIKYHSDGTRLIVRSVDVINTDTAFEKSENECWLIVILNYVEKK